MSAFDQRGGNFLTIINALFVLAFLVFHLFIDQYYCLSADDFAGIDYGSKGIPGFSYAWRFYIEWEGPFLSHFMQGLLLGSVAAGLPPFVGLIVIKLAMVTSTVTLLLAVSRRFEFNWSLNQALFAGLVLNICLYLISPEPSQIWHWLVGTLYITPLIFIQIALAALICNQFSLAIFALAFVMQSKVTYAALIFGFIVLLTVFAWFKRTENRKQWSVLSAFLLLFLLLYIIAPGNYVRWKEHGNAFPFLISQFKIGLQDLFVSYNIAKMDRVLLALLAVLPWVGFQENNLRPKQLWQWFIPAVFYVGFALAHEALFVYITGWCEWTRVLSLHSFLFLSMMFFYGFWSFTFVPESWKWKLRILSFIGMVGLLFRLFNGFNHQLEMGHQLKTNYDARMVSIMEHDGIGDTLYVNPMNYTGILYFEDFSEDPNRFTNSDFVKAYHLEFDVALETQDEK